MRKYSAIVLVLLCFSSQVANSQNRKIEFYQGSFSDLLIKAKEANKMIYIDCFTTWCGPCKRMAKDIFTNDSVADFYNSNFINVAIDMEKGEGVDIAKKYHVKNYPTMLYLDAAGNQLHRTCGSTPAGNFIANAKNALNPETQLKTYATNFKDGKVNAATAFTYFSMLENACMPYTKKVNTYFESLDTNNFTTRENWNIIYHYVDDYYSKAFDALETHKPAFVKISSADSVEGKINQIYASGLSAALEKKDLDVYESLKAKIRSSNVKDAEKIIIKADIKAAQKMEDWPMYGSLSCEYLNKYPSKDANELNSYAWKFYQKVDDKKMLANAEQWAKKATELENNYANNDTYAAVLYKSGKKAEAKKAAQKAIELAKKNEEDFSETEALLEKINALK